MGGSQSGFSIPEKKLEILLRRETGLLTGMGVGWTD